jgi:uncharacterized LabA/DUF88 family protein
MNQTSTSTLLLIDLQNLFYASKNKGQRMDFEKILAHFHSRETEWLTEAIVYMIRSPGFDSSRFERKLKNVGYSLRIKQAVKVSSGRGKRTIYKHSNHDVAIAVDCMHRLGSFDKLILMSGDGDFADLCKYLREHNKMVELWSFRGTNSSHLEPHIDRMHFIENEFFYQKPNVQVFGFNNRD